MAWSRGEMANYKVPRAVEIVDELPRQRHRQGGQGGLAGPCRAARGVPAVVTEERREALRAFDGLRVVELGVWVAAPAAGALLADWGADVIKVEPPTGDPMRGAFASIGVGKDFPNPAFAQDNRGKRSIVLDLRRDDDRARLEQLLSRADVFITNLRPDALDSLGLEPAATVARHPRLVYCSISGYGLRGEDRNRPDLRHRRLLGPIGPLVADGRRSEGNPAQRPGRHRRPHHRPGRRWPASWPPSSSSAPPDGAGGRGVAAADGHLRARVGPGPPDDAGQGGQGRGRGTATRPRS